MRFTREQYIDLLTFGPVERQMFVELFGPLVGVEEEWRRQGARDGELTLEDFDWDYVETTGCGGTTGAFPRAQPTVIEETAEYRVERDYLGRTVKLFTSMATISLPLDFPVRTREDWERLKPLYAFREERIDWSEVEDARRRQAEGSLVVAAIPGAFDTPRELMGDERACMCYYDQPEMMQDILGTLAETATRVLEKVGERLAIDQVSVSEDLAGKSGPLVGPSQVDAYFRPYYRAVWETASARGARIFQIDSDGNFAAIIPGLLACGITAMYPMEPAAGMDTVALRKAYGKRFAMLGGIDKHVLRRSRDEIDRELAYKMQPLMQQGGTVFGLDHRIPNGTPLESYRYYADRGRELLGLPARTSASRGWRRMAF
jgi:uroporphyrinogen-III decarboxylase